MADIQRVIARKETFIRQASMRKLVKNMKGTQLEKPPALLLPPVKNPTRVQGRSAHRIPIKYDNYSGIMKRVYDMKLGMDTDETTTESESSSVRTRSSRSSGTHYSDEPEGAFEDESSASSITESDHCPPYEEIPTNTNRYSCSSLPSPPPSANTLSSFGDCFPEPPSPLYNNEPVGLSRRSSSGSSSHYSNSDVVLRRPISLYNNCENDYTNTRTPLYSNDVETITTDVNKNQTGKESLGIDEIEQRKIEMFFRGLRTELWVSSSLANLYVRQKGQDGWDFKHTGVPLLVLESGDTKSRSKRRIQIILAERGTCFPLWKDTIDNLSAYRKDGQAFHTMYLSTNHQQVIGLSFDSEEEADRLLSRIETLTANPENINISVPGAKKKKTKVKEKKPASLPQKKQISNPCLFEHVTSVAAKDKPVYMSLKTLITDQGLMNKSENVARD